MKDSDKAGMKEEESRTQRREMEGKKKSGLDSGLQAVLNCSRDRKQLRQLGPQGLNREDRAQPCAEAFRPVVVV